jgi:hypothetical protein
MAAALFAQQSARSLLQIGKYQLEQLVFRHAVSRSPLAQQFGHPVVFQHRLLRNCVIIV